MAVGHPAAWPIVGHPGDADATECRHVDGVFPGKKVGHLTVHLQYLEEEAVQMKGMVHWRAVDHLPDLQLSHTDWLGLVMLFAIDVELDAVLQSQAESEAHRAIRNGWPRHQRLNLSQPIRQSHSRERGGSHVYSAERLRLLVTFE